MADQSILISAVLPASPMPLLISSKVDVGRVDANVHPEMSLLEHILLKMDFNYLDTVRLNFANGGSSRVN